METETKVRETLETVKQGCIEYNREARSLNLPTLDLVDYLIARLNAAQESNWAEGYNDGLRDGRVPNGYPYGKYHRTNQPPCPHCNGVGLIAADTNCPECNDTVGNIPF